MIPLTPSLLVAAANAFVGLGEDGGDNRGQMVELFLREVDQKPGAPWCAAFVYHVGFWSHYEAAARKSSWPLLRTASCEELGEYARKRGISLRDPHVGDVFLKYSPDHGRFTHTGIVATVCAVHRIGGDRDPHFLSECTTIEGNTNDDGSANGYTTLRKERRFNSFVGDRFVRWPDVYLRAQAA